MPRRFFLVAALGLAGCSQQPAPPAAPNAVAVAAVNPPAPPPAVALPPAPAAPQPPAKVEPPAPPPAFAFPADTAGKALPAVVAPRVPAAPPVERFGAAPVGRTPPARVVAPDVPGKIVYAAPPLLPAPAAGLKPVAPPERVPFDLGSGAAAVPTRPVLPEAPVATPKARDVNLPPDLPPLAREVKDRASLDDPTAEPANAGIVTRSPVPALGPAAFLRVALPDPFELGAQVKPAVPAAAEPAGTPVPVNPPRPK
jgi:hypothetical protein